MTSQLNVDTIKGQTAETSITIQGEGSATVNLQQGLAKAWTTLQADASSDYVYDSFNNSGHVDNGSGDHTISYTNSFRAAHNYTTGGTQTHTSDSGTSLSMKPYTKATILTGSTRYNALYVHASGAGVADNEYACVTSHGDLA